ncbi:hypothetical protein P170DRAFT_493972 [Aspergillus steynii IBT 23096]|uniref:Uncharacterized protein n=1 Tax=Aspergillus steynii IBT 23096 TaxID=1392250 RepID=A0A2I2G6W1_9EURO|nr:uncharacterized protein P170DRAFT_493972 [Aspergillus steynii IBT 23096]PLB48617.1 hypothetical protein P170DRAFT_493972 [Aspergillus steynii IBT 23096]
MQSNPSSIFYGQQGMPAIERLTLEGNAQPSQEEMPPIERLILEENSQERSEESDISDVPFVVYPKHPERRMITMFIPQGTGTCIDIGCVLRAFHAEILERLWIGNLYHRRDLRCRAPGPNYVFSFWPASLDPVKYHEEAANILSQYLEYHSTDVMILPWSSSEMYFVLDLIE